MEKLEDWQIFPPRDVSTPVENLTAQALEQGVHVTLLNNLVTEALRDAGAQSDWIAREIGPHKTESIEIGFNLAQQEVVGKIQVAVSELIPWAHPLAGSVIGYRVGEITIPRYFEASLNEYDPATNSLLPNAFGENRVVQEATLADDQYLDGTTLYDVTYLETTTYNALFKPEGGFKLSHESFMHNASGLVFIYLPQVARFRQRYGSDAFATITAHEVSHQYGLASLEQVQFRDQNGKIQILPIIQRGFVRLGDSQFYMPIITELSARLFHIRILEAAGLRPDNRILPIDVAGLPRSFVRDSKHLIRSLTRYLNGEIETITPDEELWAEIQEFSSKFTAESKGKLELEFNRGNVTSRQVIELLAMANTYPSANRLAGRLIPSLYSKLPPIVEPSDEPVTETEFLNRLQQIHLSGLFGGLEGRPLHLYRA